MYFFGFYFSKFLKNVFFCNFLTNESDIRIKRYRVCGGTDKLQNEKKRNVLPSKL